jgi:hypothetical protein
VRDEDATPLFGDVRVVELAHWVFIPVVVPDRDRT